MKAWQQLLQNPSFQLENTRAVLTHLSHNHLKDLTQIGCDPRIWVYNSRFNCDSEQKIKEYIDRALYYREQFVRIPLAIYDKKLQKYGGSTSFYGMNEEYNKIGIGYTWYGVDLQRTGLNRAVKSLMLEYSFNVLKCRRVEFHINSKNQASRASVEYYGARLEGIIRNDCFRYNGENVDTALYSILPEDYENIKEKIIVY
ncbi:hypothetical protein ABPG72_003782 [Tetrahymena utriculariae]